MRDNRRPTVALVGEEEGGRDETHDQYNRI